MLGPMGARIMDLLKIMTPNEIDRYIDKTAEESTEQVKIASGGESFDALSSNSNPNPHSKSNKNDADTTESSEHEAKIIPIRAEVIENIESDKKSLKQSPQLSNDDSEEEGSYHATKNESELEAAGIFSAGKIDALKREKLKKQKANQESTTNFILGQREKLKKTKLKLVEMEAIRNYNQNSNIESINNEIDLENPEEEVVIGSKGILVNKKHY